MKLYEFVRVIVDKKLFIDRSDWVKYLTLSKFQIDILKKKNPEILETNPTVDFMQFVEEEIQSYLDGRAPAKEIVSAVMNCADMYVCGEPMSLRAGDYINLQNYHRNKMLKA
jgi:hypothetical protein